VDLDPSELTHVRGLAQTLLSEEKYNEALTVYQKLAEMLPDDADTYLRIAQIYRELHQLDKAEENLVKARQYAPGSLEVMYNEAMIYESQGRFEDAIRVLSDAVTGVKAQSKVLPSRRRSLAILYQQLGMLYKDTQNYQAAIYTFQELGHLGDEEDRRSRLLIMDTYRQARDLPKALQAGKEAIAKYPDDSSIRSSLAMMLGEAQQPDEAIKLLQVGLKGNAGDRDTYLSYAQIYERSHRYTEAEAAARKAEALAVQPAENELAWLILGAIFERQKQYDKAEEEFKKVIDVNPKNSMVLNYYGYMLADRGIRLDEARDLPKALQAGKESLAKYPDDSSIRSSLAMMLGEAQQPDEAIKLLQVGLKGGAGNRETYLSYAQIYERSHRFTEAEAAARKAESLAVQPVSYTHLTLPTICSV